MKSVLIAPFLSLALLASCTQEPREPAGEIDYVGSLAGVGVRDSVHVRWSSVRTDRVYVRPVIDGEEGAQLDAAGFDPVGSASFTIDPNAVRFATDDDTAGLKFQLLTRERDDADDYDLLDETATLEIANVP